MYAGLGGMRRCFQPRQWFDGEGEPDPQVVREEDAFMWVYRNRDEVYQVGYFMPDGTWVVESDYATREEAAARVHYLNGGKRVV